MYLDFIYQGSNLLRNRLLCCLCTLLLCLPARAVANEWIYTVKPGDNLWNLSERHLTGVQYVQRLQQMNRIKDPYVIPPGKKLRIPVAWSQISDAVTARVNHVQGTVLIERSNRGEILAEPGMELYTGDTIRAENDSFVTIEFADNSRMRVQDNSRIRLDKMRIYGDFGLIDTLIHLEQGRTENSVPRDTHQDKRFRIQTPSAVSSVRGTDFRVGTVEMRSGTASEVLSGIINVSGSKKHVIVPAGFGTVTSRDEPPMTPVVLLPPPDLSGTSGYYESLPLVIHLTPLNGAHAYRTQIALDPDFDNLVSEFTTTTLPFRDGDIPDGEYWLRIRGIDKFGLEGKDAVMPFALNARPEPPFVTAPLPGSATTPDNQEFTWTSQSEPVHYIVMISKDIDFSDLVYFNPELKKNALALSKAESLAPGHYFWQIAAVSPTEGAGPFSDAMPFRVPFPGPALEKTEIDEQDLTFAWRAAAEGQRFHFQFARDESFSDIIHDETTEASSITIQKPAGGTYFLRIKTIESDGFEGPWGLPQMVEIPRDFPYWMMLLLLLPLLVLI
ncbi:FecR family protein [Nitrosomonas marina]|uniref:FecR family protein n=1 Tax=Nitrosomonas marina TaxID=917 RepID=A0A1H9ZUC9_9PROT|nr:FecR domain-containing protein [Nitrosomonas marina]SES84437.1 FecR family protein [Nitrosomonas marina]